MTNSDGGLTNHPVTDKNLGETMAIAAFVGISWYNVVELNVSIFMVFKKRRGLYFWSLLISSWGILFHSLGFLLKLYGVVTIYQITCSFITIGWYSMVTGQSLVLYSRLHLIIRDQRILRAVLCMILWDAVTLHIPTTVLTFGSNSPSYASFSYGYNVMEKIQMTMFCCQEFIISGLYIWGTVRLLKPVYWKRTRSVMMQLLWINGVIVAMDITLLVMEYQQQYAIETCLKGMVYSIKLKLEFAVLNQLMRLANSSRQQAFPDLPADSGSGGGNGAVLSKTASNSGRPSFFRRILPMRNQFHNEEESIQSPRSDGPPAQKHAMNDLAPRASESEFVSGSSDWASSHFPSSSSVNGLTRPSAIL